MPALIPPVIPPSLRRQAWAVDVPDAVPIPARLWADDGLQPPQDSPWGVSEPPQISPWGGFGGAVGSLRMANSVGASPWAASQSAMWPASSTQESQEPLLSGPAGRSSQHQPPNQPGDERASVGRGILCAALTCCLPSCTRVQVCSTGDMWLVCSCLQRHSSSSSLSLRPSVPAIRGCPQCPAVSSILCICMLPKLESGLAAASDGQATSAAIMLAVWLLSILFVDLLALAPCSGSATPVDSELSLQICQPTRMALAESSRPFAGADGGQDSYTAIIRSAWLLSLVLIAAALGRPRSPLANATGIAAAVSVATTLLATAARPLPRPEAPLSGEPCARRSRCLLRLT